MKTKSNNNVISNVIDTGTRHLDNKIRQIGIQSISKSSWLFFKKLTLYFFVMVLSFISEFFKKILPNSEKLQTASIEEIKQHIFENTKMFNIIKKVLSDDDFIQKWQSMFDEFYTKLVKPILDGGIHVFQQQIDTYEDILEELIYKFSKSTIKGIWESVKAIPIASQIIAVIEVVGLIIESMVALIKSSMGPIKFIIELSELLGDIGGPIKNTILRIKEIYETIIVIYNMFI